MTNQRIEDIETRRRLALGLVIRPPHKNRRRHSRLASALSAVAVVATIAAVGWVIFKVD